MNHRLVIPDVARLAAEQDGVVSTQDLRELGLTPKQVRRRVDAGWLTKAAPRVFRITGSPDTHRQRLRIGLLSLGPQSWVSYEAAAALHGLDRSDRDAVEFTVPRGGAQASLDATVHTTTMWSASDAAHVTGLRTTSATRTIIDLAHSRAPQARVEAAFDSAVRSGASHPQVLAERLTTLRGSGRWGCRLIDRILPDSGVESPLERRFLRLVVGAGLPRPIMQAVQRDLDGRHVARVDFFYEHQRLAVEVTGRRGHVSDRERSRDAQRRNELQELGIAVIEFTSTTIRNDPLLVIASLRRALAART
ncbi:MAG: type IV toxin-antitoxin system AbiEi family antitoxin domain-containing protein [Ilumatobacter sp.]